MYGVSPKGLVRLANKVNNLLTTFAIGLFLAINSDCCHGNACEKRSLAVAYTHEVFAERNKLRQTKYINHYGEVLRSRVDW